MTVRETNAFFRQLINVRCFNVGPITSEIRPAGVIQHDEEKVRSLRGPAEGRCQKPAKNEDTEVRRHPLLISQVHSGRQRRVVFKSVVHLMSEPFRMRIKVCCIQSIEEAQLALSHGAHALGLVSQMPSGSGFMIDDDEIRSIVEAVPPTNSTVLLTSEDDPLKIIRHQHTTGANTLQLLGPISFEGMLRLKETRPDITLIKVVPVVDSTSIDEALRFSKVADALLLDSKVSYREGGGTGKTHDWSISRQIVQASSLPVWLAGGLSPSNVAEAIRTVMPFGVDVCSGLRPNRSLELSRLRSFVSEVKVSAKAIPSTNRRLHDSVVPHPESNGRAQ